MEWLDDKCDKNQCFRNKRHSQDDCNVVGLVDIYIHGSLKKNSRSYDHTTQHLKHSNKASAKLKSEVYSWQANYVATALSP